MRIIGPPSATRQAVTGSLLAMGTAVHPRFTSQMLPPLWEAAWIYGIDPVGVIAQSFKETGGGSFRGQVKPEFYNTCGLKNRHLGLFPGVDDLDAPLAHARFASWDVGAVAHVQHLCAYAGHPLDDLIVDPRYHLVAGTKVPLENFEELGGRWAPSSTYGTELVAIARKLQGRA